MHFIGKLLKYSGEKHQDGVLMGALNSDLTFHRTV